MATSTKVCVERCVRKRESRMDLKLIKAIAIFFSWVFCSQVSAQGTQPNNQHTAVQLIEGLGHHHHQITTSVPAAQIYFDQGLILSYAFNHNEARKSFLEAARLDPNCAMCYWGAALVSGPNINNIRMDEDDIAQAWEAISRAKQLASRVTTHEQDYIQALARRYSEKPLQDRSDYDRAYANAMHNLAKRYPQDTDAVTLFAEAAMDLHPWDYWTKRGKPQAWTPEILTALQRALKIDPNHPGANHFYIHAVEASPHPEWGLRSADLLRTLVPSAGHLLHMPAHIYIRTGRYHDASEVNESAIRADSVLTSQCHGRYLLAYQPHNYQFLWAAATLEGRSKVALNAAKEVARRIRKEDLHEPLIQHYWVTPLYAYVRFGHWNAILAEPDPELSYPRGVWHYARAIAFAKKEDIKNAEEEYKKLIAIQNQPELKISAIAMNNAADILRIASEVARAEIALAKRNYNEAVRALKIAIKLEDNLRYDEPADWHHPVRQLLGKVLLMSNKSREAEKIYLEDLKQLPENGWSLFGLKKSLRKQGKIKLASGIEKRFKKAWSYADVELPSSSF